MNHFKAYIYKLPLLLLVWVNTLYALESYASRAQKPLLLQNQNASLLDKFKVQHEVGFSSQVSNNGSLYWGNYTSHIDYIFSKSLNLSLDLSFLHPLKGSGIYENRGGMIMIPRVSLYYQLSKNSSLLLSYSFRNTFGNHEQLF